MGEEELCVSDARRLGAVQALSEIEDPYETGAEVDAQFARAMRQAVAWHRDECPFYRRFLEHHKFTPECVDSVTACSRIPAIHANYFKTHEVLSIPKESIYLHLTSSGTTGQKSQVFLDKWSIKAGHRQLRFVWKRLNLLDDAPNNYLLFSYEPFKEGGTKLGTAFTDKTLTQYAPANHVTYSLKALSPTEHEFDIFGTVRALQEFAEEGLPVRILGFPAFLHFTLQKMKTLGIPPLKLNPKSLTMFGGGWKGNADKAIPKADLYRQIEDQLGIPTARCRDSYGSVEHAVPYIECPHHNLHIPVWARLWARDVKTLEPLDYGKPGFANFVSAYRTSMPVLSVLMGDLVRVMPGSDCPCGIERPYFEILGRAGTSKNKSCAIAASELLGGKS